MDMTNRYTVLRITKEALQKGEQYWKEEARTAMTDAYREVAEEQREAMLQLENALERGELTLEVKREIESAKEG